MAAGDISFIVGDTNTPLLVTVYTNEASPVVVDLSTSTVELVYKIGEANAQYRAMTITDAANGKAQYTFASGELTEGTMECEVVVTNASGLIATSTETFTYDVRARLT